MVLRVSGQERESALSGAPASGPAALSVMATSA